MQPLSKTNTKGFTLPEMLVVLTILAVVGGALSSAIYFFYLNNGYVLQETSAIQSARIGVSSALSDLRQAAYGADGAYPMETSATTSVLFYADVDHDGIVDKVRYYLATTTLYRDTTKATSTPPTYTGGTKKTQTIAEYVRMGTSTPIFTYYNHDSVLLAQPVDPAQVASVYVKMIIDVDPTRTPNPFTLTGGATLRNLRVY